jgi:hypothetical protein
MFEAKVSGLTTAFAKAQAVIELKKRIAIMTAYGMAEEIMTDAKQNYVPVDDGILRASGHVKAPQYVGDDVHIILAFGGAAEDYAVIQHEALNYQHTVGEAKYLEKPWLAKRDSISGRVAAAIQVAG